jgi:acylphosphatase
MMRRLHFLVTGRVQGVGFRAATSAAAHRRQLTGFVQNRDDGTVEGEAQGAHAEVEAFAAWLAQGPAFARVDRVDLRELPALEQEGSFDVRRGTRPS